VLSSQLLYFEREDGGGFRPSDSYSHRALVTVNTHDHAPLAAFREGRDIEIRRRLGLSEPHEADEAQRHREHERRMLVERLRAEGDWSGDAEPGRYAELAAAVHRFLARTPAPLVGLSLDDLAAETTPVNVPGIGPDRFPTWSRKMRLTLEELRRDPDVARILAGAAPRLRAAGPDTLPADA
jgi:4-alpha-glucanotransferase